MAEAIAVGVAFGLGWVAASVFWHRVHLRTFEKIMDEGWVVPGPAAFRDAKAALKQETTPAPR